MTATHELARERIDANEPALIDDFITFLKQASLARHPSGPMPRFNQGRAAGCVDAELMVPADLRPELKVGLFAAPATYRARIRFAHASSASDTERDVRGMSIKVFDAGGTNLTDGRTEQDFILNSHPVMMVGDTKDFLDLLKANEAGGARRVLYFVTHPRAAAIALASRGHASSPLELPYYSTTPYLFGDGRAVKYIATPAAGTRTPLPDPLTDDYLHERLVATLAAGEVFFDLRVQVQTNADTMPIEDASVEWSEGASPYRTVARLRLPRQTVARDEGCERLSFNPWHARTEHRPLGSYNRARRAIYDAMAAFRATRA